MTTADMILLNLHKWIVAAGLAGFFCGAFFTWIYYKLADMNNDDDFWGWR